MKKLLLGLGSVASVAAPLISVISCGGSLPDEGEDKPLEEKQKVSRVIEKLKNCGIEEGKTFVSDYEMQEIMTGYTDYKSKKLQNFQKIFGIQNNNASQISAEENSLEFLFIENKEESKSTLGHQVTITVSSQEASVPSQSIKIRIIAKDHFNSELSNLAKEVRGQLALYFGSNILTDLGNYFNPSTIKSTEGIFQLSKDTPIGGNSYYEREGLNNYAHFLEKTGLIERDNSPMKALIKKFEDLAQKEFENSSLSFQARLSKDPYTAEINEETEEESNVFEKVKRKVVEIKVEILCNDFTLLDTGSYVTVKIQSADKVSS